MAEARQMAMDTRQLANRQRDVIEARPGGLAGYRSGLVVREVAFGDEATLRAFHAVLATGILPTELVPLASFRSVIGVRRGDADLVSAFGPHRYFCLVLQEADGAIIGATGSMVVAHPDGPPSFHTSYAAILPAFRGLGLSRMLFAQTVMAGLTFLRSTGHRASDMLHVIETNAIATMTWGERLLDEAIAMHPLDRDAYWEAQGFRELLRIAYRQRAEPPLPLALKCRWIAASTPHAGASTPVDRLDGAMIVRHVCAFDNLLLNADVARERARSRLVPLDPRDEGLLAPLSDAGLYWTWSLDAARADRERWRAREERIAKMSAPPLSASMATLAKRLDGVENAARK